MKNKFLVTITAISLCIYACSPALYLHSTPEVQLKEDSIVQTGFLQKKHDLNFSILQKKAERRKYMKKITRLCAESLSLFRASKMPSADYINFCSAFTEIGDALWLYASAEHNGSSVYAPVLEKIRENIRKLSEKEKVAFTVQEPMVKAGSPDPFALVCALFISVMNQALDKYRH